MHSVHSRHHLYCPAVSSDYPGLSEKLQIYVATDRNCSKTHEEWITSKWEATAKRTCRGKYAVVSQKFWDMAPGDSDHMVGVIDCTVKHKADGNPEAQEDDRSWWDDYWSYGEP